MIEFGKTLRDAREAKGLSVAQLADVTHMTVNTINELESEDFTHIPAPIYGRGFVKLYCETVGLDPKPLIAEFMDILNGNRADFIRERPTAAPAPVSAPESVDVPQEQPAVTDASLPADETEAADEPASADEPSPADEPSSADDEPDPEPPAQAIPEPEPSMPDETFPEPQPRAPIISQQDFFQDTPLPEPVSHVPPRRAASPSQPIVPPSLQTAPHPAATNEPQISRYAAPVEQTRAYAAPAYGRIAVLAAAALIVILLLVLGIRTLYRATSAKPEPVSETPAIAEAPKPAAEEAKTPAAAAKTKAPAKKPTPAATKPTPEAAKPKPSRTPQRIPSLYID